MTPIISVDGRRLALSNLEKVLYPADGFTKGEVLHYYATVADVLLPHLRDRAVSFLRYPDGPDGQVFFTKNVPPGTPEWVTKAQVTRSDGVARMVVVQDLASLMWAANLVAEFHTHQWTLTHPDHADRLVLDLDPGPPAGVAECCRVALWLRERLAADGIEAFVKTSGAKGLHLLAPVRDASPEQVSEYARRLAVEAETALPALVVHRMNRGLRPGKVFLDWSQNAARKTTATPYTLRARPEATASTPVRWEEIAECRDGLVFRAGDVVPRIQKYGDLLAPLFEADRAGRLPQG
ncbi:non-homologous end-joining DNA ligase [Streptomyces sp. NPDC004539]|uniref:non-homologous end-joining DNA ligase n=1 Tax=Streptomyces sp. NPDC004539 TaxID=3154280 RepID=UPI0033B99752